MQKAGRAGRSRLRILAVWMVGLALASPTVVLAQSDSLDSLIDGKREGGAAGGRPALEPAADNSSREGSTEAASGERRRVLEEIIVTAQKVEQSLHEVPISMSVLDTEFLNQENISDLSELSRHVPNVVVLPAAFVPRANMRGFGTDERAGANKGLESPIGVNIDGVSYGSKIYLQSGFFDLDRVEVLRGPQNTLFGKNNSVGLFNMVTKNPTDELDGFFDVELGEPDRRHFSSGVGGPILPGFLNVRIAGISEERDGFSRNTVASTVPTARSRMWAYDRKAIRAKVQFPDLFGANVTLSYEKFVSDIFGIGLGFSLVPEGTRPLFREFDPDIDFEFGNYTVSTDTPNVAKNRFDTFVANAAYDIGDWGLNAVVGYSTLAVDAIVDGDTGPSPAIIAATKDKNPQTTFELRATSPKLPGLLGLESLFGRSLGWADFTSGVFYQHREVNDSEFTVTLDTALVGAFSVLGRRPPPPGVPSPPEGVPITRATVGNYVESTTMFWDASWDTVAGYGQMNWHFAERWTLIGGMRLSHEWRAADWNRVFGGQPPVFLTAGQFEEFIANETETELLYAPRVNLRYDLTDDINVFATWAEGFRAGGFSESATQSAFLTFESESTTNWEVGSNMEIFGGTARLNLALFRTTIGDFQLLTTNPDTGFSEITNAGEARSQGVELDGTWLPLDWMSVRGTVALNDSEYLKFPFGPCSADRPDTDGDADEPGGDDRCDLSGRQLQRAPQWVITLTPSVSYPLASVPGLGTLPLAVQGIEMILGVSGEYQDTSLLEPTLDPRTRQKSFFRVNGHLGFGNVGQGWSARVSMMNLTDQLASDGRREVSLFPGHFVAGETPPRHVFGELRWSF